jgi:ferrous iron transport protein B
MVVFPELGFPTSAISIDFPLSLIFFLSFSVSITPLNSTPFSSSTSSRSLTDIVSSRFYAIKLLEKDEIIQKELESLLNFEIIKRVVDNEIRILENSFKEDSETLITDSRYGFIAGALKETFTQDKLKRQQKTETEIIDTFITHKIFGFPIFLFFLWLMFYSTFTLGEYPMKWIEAGVGFVSEFVSKFMPDGMLKDLLVDGVISGVGSVIVFLPNILILFFFITFMEDTGYMARVVFIMDRIMHRIGLHGRSFIPMLMGFGCNVPAIMATRTIESRSDRILTILINPFMSCSARLPVYILIIGAFFPSNPTMMLLLIYGIGVMIAAIIAIAFKKIFFRKKEAPFVMELPPYRLPTLKAILKNMWYKASLYLQKMGGIILLAVILVWAAGYFPQNRQQMYEFDKMIGDTKQDFQSQLSEIDPTIETERFERLHEEMNMAILKIDIDKQSYRLENSFIGKFGHLIEPLIRPLGFDWKMGVSLVTGAAAKEIVVGTLGVLYHADDPGNHQSLIEKLRSQRHQSGPKAGQLVFTPVTAIAFLIFVLIYFPCVAVVAAVKKETGGWRWAAFLALYTTVLAYLLSLLVYQVGILIY